MLICIVIIQLSIPHVSIFKMNELKQFYLLTRSNKSKNTNDFIVYFGLIFYKFLYEIQFYLNKLYELSSL